MAEEQMLSRQHGAPRRPVSLINGDSEMANRIRRYNWAATPIGSIDGWSETLVATVNLMLHSPFPTILSWGPEMVFLYNDAAIPTLMGKHPTALGGLYHEVFHEAWDLVSGDLEACFLRGETPVRDNMFIPILLNGVVEDHYWNYSLIPVYENGQIAGVYDAYRNTTELVISARKLLESEARLKMAAEVAELGIFVWHTTDDVPRWENNRMYQIFGRTREEGPVNGAMFINEVVHPDFRESFKRAMEATLQNGVPFYFAGMILRKDGSEGWIEATGQLQAATSESQGRILGTIRDITRVKKSEEALRTAEKLSVVGRLAASIAHEINNPLAAVMNLLYLARMTDDMAAIKTHLDTAELELRRVSAITNQTLRFYRQTTAPKDASCKELFESVLSIYQGRLAKPPIEVQLRMRASHAINCFDGEIRQVLSNLVGNAIDAMQPEGGRLLLRSRESTNWRSGTRGLTLTVADTGIGMTAAVMERIFEPFFTTKGSNGTGLGLWVSEDIVKRHRGILEFRSRQRESRGGTVFTLFLPFDGLSQNVVTARS
jgi:PAS domain S-box-containing protein